ncbi:hypothetical protein FHS00_000010 [Limimaricola variabilis]|uniref:Ferric reductase like transmembrane component n=3 Tax=Limimaricola variabilis TaxID=1492771 RepID=A0ABR6HJ05_9RHOB|nr:hypothetical protein [Limimaricola variabilis]
MTATLAGISGMKSGARSSDENAAPSKGEKPKAARRQTGAFELPIMLTLSFVVLAYAWTRRLEGDLTAETGLGYFLGIGGALAMLTLLLYPLRKRFAGLRFIGNVRNWFRIHMMLGIIGPVLIILHSNFTLGSLNSTMALFAMLIVAASGLIGRLFYARIHKGLYGRRASVREYLNDMEALKHEFDTDMPDPSWLLETLKAYEARRLPQTQDLWSNFHRTLTGPVSRFRLRREVMRRYAELLRRQDGPKRDRSGLVRQHLDSYLHAVARAQSFALYERLFALWHLFHLPLFVILVFAAIVHVVGVHLY